MSASEMTTLHDFVLNLMTDEAARSAFAADPTATLSAAGLEDVTAQDVQEVVPLVMDYAPAGFDSLDSSLAMVEDPTSATAAIEQLQAVAQAADSNPLGACDMNLDGDMKGGTFSWDGSLASQADALPGGLSGYGQTSLDGSYGHAAFATDDLSSESAYRANLDGVAAGHSTETALGEASFGSVASADGFTGAAHLGNDDLGGGGSLSGGLDGVTYDSGAHTPVGDFMMGGSATLDGTSLHTQAGDFSLSVEAGVDGVAISGSTPLGDFDSEYDRADPSGMLDSDALARGADPAAGALAGYVSNGGDMLADQIDSGTDTLAGYLTGVGGVDATSAGTDALSGLGSQLSVPEVPAVPGLPEVPTSLPATPAVPGVPEVPGLPELSVPELPGLPGLPDLPVANPLPSLGDAVSDSPLSGLTGAAAADPVQGLTGDLPLG